MNSCTACQHGKRKCNRARPTCSTCARVGKTCIYDDLPRAARESLEGSSSVERLSDAVGAFQMHTALPVPWTNLNPVQWKASKRSTVDSIVAAEALRLIGPWKESEWVTKAYFDVAHRHLPMISAQRLRSRILKHEVAAPADLTALCLSMSLIQRLPSHGVEDVATDMYANIKGIMSLMEAAQYQSLEFVQCLVLVALYEFGHGMQATASMTIAACARLARLLGLHIPAQTRPSSPEDQLESEERWRTWWSVVYLDRFTNYCIGDSFFSTPDLTALSPIPSDDTLWSKDTVPDGPPHTLSTPCSPLIGIFARQCQVIHLLTSVSRNVFDPSILSNADLAWKKQEADQLEKTMMAFKPLLLEEREFDTYSIPLSICASALFTLRHTMIGRGHYDLVAANALMDELSLRMTQAMYAAWANLEEVDPSRLSPFIIHTIYQCAVIQHRAWKERGDRDSSAHIDWLIGLLRVFEQRWAIAGKYLDALKQDNPPIVLSIQN